jgi:hypothetical protein
MQVGIKKNVQLCFSDTIFVISSYGAHNFAGNDLITVIFLVSRTLTLLKKRKGSKESPFLNEGEAASGGLLPTASDAGSARVVPRATGRCS